MTEEDPPVALEESSPILSNDKEPKGDSRNPPPGCDVCPPSMVEKESEASIELLLLKSTDKVLMTARSKCECQCFRFQDLPEDVGKWWVRKWVIFSKELATCDDSLGLSAIWMKGSTHVEARRKVFMVESEDDEGRTQQRGTRGALKAHSS